MDDLILAQQSAVDPEERAAILKEIQQQVAEDLPVVVLWNPLYVTAFQCYVGGEHEAHLGFWMTRFEFMRIEQ